MPLREIWRQFLSANPFEEAERIISVMQNKQGANFSEWKAIYSQIRYFPDNCPLNGAGVRGRWLNAQDFGGSEVRTRLNWLKAVITDKMLESAHTFDELNWAAACAKADGAHKNRLTLATRKMCGLAETFSEWADILSICEDSGRIPILKKMIEKATSYNDWSTIVEATYKPYPYDNGPERPIRNLALKKMNGR